MAYLVMSNDESEWAPLPKSFFLWVPIAFRRVFENLAHTIANPAVHSGALYGTVFKNEFIDILFTARILSANRL